MNRGLYTPYQLGTRENIWWKVEDESGRKKETRSFIGFSICSKPDTKSGSPIIHPLPTILTSSLSLTVSHPVSVSISRRTGPGALEETMAMAPIDERRKIPMVHSH